ncbi:4-carboxymuconolactone decarboxylase [Actinocorallia herbida]|uniref:4-carboxymuconolactone decarboxylase n=1 Tax=Actinocorallia herbida TaxID=58109 RepID=A0A3N1D6J4_9ACTN|nr:carboxymuconolactone decarboxylase family protein [Actinocorallia herbida]ROO89134.1 4-carboxymuconolactone decarboxylase [Actinocorallia herbida]
MSREERYARGLEVMRRIDTGEVREAVTSVADVSPELAHQIIAWAYGEMLARPVLAPRDRQLVTLGMLAALGGCEPQLELHVGASLNAGLSPEEVVEALLQSAVYCGMPRALNAAAVARKVFAARGIAAPDPAC